MYLALESTVKREAVRVADQVITAFKDSLDRAGLKARLEMTYTITTFPDEAPNEDAYLTKIISRKAA